MKSVNDDGDDILPLSHGANPNIATRKLLANGTHNSISNHLLDGLQMVGSERVFVHQRVHRWKEICRCGGRKGSKERCLGLFSIGHVSEQRGGPYHYVITYPTSNLRQCIC